MNEEPQYTRIDPDTFPCPICGAQSFQWGFSVGDSPSQRLYARAESAGWGEGEVLYTRKCVTCSNVQLFTVKK